MTRQRSAAVARGLGSLILLGFLLIGPPLALATLVGWPLPTDVPDLASVEQAVRSGVNDDIIVKSLAIVGWLAWAQIAAAIATEVVAVLRGRPSIHLPVLPGFQATAGRLVASIAMMTATFSPATAMAAAAPPVPVVTFATPPTPVAVPPPAWTIASVPEATPVAATPDAAPATITVERHDSYWGIAERALGDGYRWREIRDFNVGRTMNTGDVIAPGSDLVHPGWVLSLPADAGSTLPLGVEPSASPAPAGDVVVEEGDNFWELAEEQMESATGRLPTDAETAPYWQDMIEANQDRLVQPGNPNLILPGQKLCVPPVPGASPVGGPTDTPVIADEPAVPPLEVPPPGAAPAPAPAPAPVPAPVTVAPPPVTLTAPAEVAPSTPIAADAEAGNPALPALAAGLASAALAVGATRTVRNRRRRAAHRAPQSLRAPTSDEARAVHRELLADADDVAVDDLRRCLGELAQALAATGCATRPRIVQHSTDHLDVYLNAPNAVAPPGWRAEADGAVWSLRSTAAEGDADAASICAAPLLVTIGQPDDGGQLYLDLEADGVISLIGEPDMARAVARSILTELAFTPLADTLEVMVIGDLAPPDAKALDHVTLADSWEEAREDLAAWAEQSHQVLLEKEWPNPFLARGDDPYHDALAPVAVVACKPPPSDLLDTILLHRPATLVVVAVGDMHGATLIECTSDSLTIPEVGLVCTPYPLEAEALDAIIDLVESADDPGESADGQLSLLASSVLVEPDPSGPDPETLVEPEYDVLVRTLGDIRVEGGDPLATKHAAAVAYIAIHGTVTADALEEAVWASSTGASRRKRMANTISECRALLGRKLLPTASDGRYKAGPGLMTDLELFDRRVRRAADQQPTDAADTLLSAMELVTGKLFNYRNADRSSFSWVDLENWVSRWEMKVAAVAQRCADVLLDVGRVDEAVEVALHALSVIPTHTALTETLMRAHAANGDRLAVQRVFQEHVGALEALDLDDAEPSTTELCERLLGARAG